LLSDPDYNISVFWVLVDLGLSGDHARDQWKEKKGLTSIPPAPHWKVDSG
jgi:hypothetical protein